MTDIRPGYVLTPLTQGNKSMPSALDADTAAKSIARAIRARRAVHAFPLPKAAMTRSR